MSPGSFNPALMSLAGHANAHVQLLVMTLHAPQQRPSAGGGDAWAYGRRGQRRPSARAL